YAVFANVGDNLGTGYMEYNPITGRDEWVDGDLWQGGDIGYYGTLDSWLTGNGSFGADGRAWWAGFAFDLSEFDPFIAALDFVYGSYSADDAPASLAYDQPFTDTTKTDRAGWAIIAKLGYKLDYFTPNIIGWYGSGADVDNNEGLDGLLPSLSPFWGMTSFGYVGSTGVGSRDAMIGASPAGTWGIALGLDDIRFIDNLTSHFRVAYYRGTNDVEEYNKEALQLGGKDAFRNMKLLDKSDWAFEVNLDNTIQIYENLDMFVELAYMHVDVDQADSTFDENAYKGYVGFKYSF
ncbi:MAG: hypothetical protein IJD04_07945, partial [Desulfovibrionaceae bacterium]|nr:hypothetical protein [Desulfovibrionaceae bacterium]